MTHAKRVLVAIIVVGLAFSVVFATPPTVWAQGSKASESKSEKVPSPNNVANGPGQKEFDAGIEFLEKGESDEAIAQLEFAVAKDSQNPHFHIGLVHAYAAARESAKSWKSLRSAVELDDKNPALGVALIAAWQSFGIEGLFNVGRPAEEVAKALGKADRVERHADHERWIYGFMAVNFADGKLDSVMDLRGLSREMLKEKDRLTIETDGRKWIAGHRLVSNVHTTTEYVLPGQQVQNWRELVTVERLLGLAERRVAPKQLMESIKQRIQSIDPKAEWKVLAENDDNVIYEWRFSDDGKRPAHHEMARLVKGQQDIYRIAYSARTDFGSNRDVWAKLLGSAKLVDLTGADATSTAAQGSESSSPKLFCYELGSTLGLSMALYNADAKAGATQKVVDKTRVLAQIIGKQLPEFPELTGSRAANQNSLLRFAIKTVGSPYAKTVRDKYGDENMLLFELGLKSNLLLLIYQPGQSSVESIARAITEAAEANDIPQEIWGNLVAAIDAGKPFTEIKSHVMTLNREVSKHLISN